VPLADEFFFIAHEVQTGKLRLNARSAGLGLAGGLLGELVLHGNIDVANGTLTVVDGQAVPEDDLGYRILRQLAADRQNRSLRTWLLFFSQGALERVGVRYMPTDVNMAVWPADRLNVLVGRGDPLDFPDAMLAGLVAVTGLTKQVWWDGDAVTLRNIAAAVASLPISLREILSHTEAAVGDATLSPHS
jgi:hypothetical protein